MASSHLPPASRVTDLRTDSANDEDIKLLNATARQWNASQSTSDSISIMSNPQGYPLIVPGRHLSIAGLHLDTDMTMEDSIVSTKENVPSAPGASISRSGQGIAGRIALSARSTTASTLSPTSALSSPGLGPMADLTPLPSPLVTGESPNPWRRNASFVSISEAVETPTIHSPRIDSIAAQKQKAYRALLSTGSSSSPIIGPEGRTRNRSISDYVPEGLQVPKTRPIAVSASGGPDNVSLRDGSEAQMHREEHLRMGGLPSVGTHPPTPPASTQGGTESDDNEEITKDDTQSRTPSQRRYEYFEARSIKDDKPRRWRYVRELGQGTFSKVILATLQGSVDGYEGLDESQLDPKALVAVKIIEHGPAGGASEERMEVSLQRELEILKSLHHPCIIHLKACSIELTRALLVLTYCPGGDLFDLASQRHQIFTPGLTRRIFAELVGAVHYLHTQNVVHRDIKLENVLLNIKHDALVTITDWESYPAPVCTLTDLGLSRRIEPSSPLLSTRCGSEDYAAPEILMGQSYDGRATDAWALGVLLYALMEGRLPFDPVAGERTRSRTAHRVARVEWRWVKFSDSEGEPIPDFGDFQPAREIVESLLKRSRSRSSLDAVADLEWVKGGVQVSGGLELAGKVDV